MRFGKFQAHARTLKKVKEMEKKKKVPTGSFLVHWTLFAHVKSRHEEMSCAYVMEVKEEEGKMKAESGTGSVKRIESGSGSEEMWKSLKRKFLRHSFPYYEEEEEEEVVEACSHQTSPGCEPDSVFVRKAEAEADVDAEIEIVDVAEVRSDMNSEVENNIAIESDFDFGLDSVASNVKVMSSYCPLHAKLLSGRTNKKKMSYFVSKKEGIETSGSRIEKIVHDYSYWNSSKHILALIVCAEVKRIEQKMAG